MRLELDFDKSLLSKLPNAIEFQRVGCSQLNAYRFRSHKAIELTLRLTDRIGAADGKHLEML